MNEEKTFESWAIVELMGHSKIAGMASQYALGGKTMLRVDVPATSLIEPFTRFINPDAIYAINPCTEETAKKAAESFRVRPIELYDVERTVEKALRLKLEAPKEVERGPIYDEDFEKDDDE